MNKEKRQNAEYEFLGDDPVSHGEKFVPSNTNILRALNWYSYYYEANATKKWAEEFLGRSINVRDFPQWVGVYSRLLLHKCPMPEGIADKIRNAVEVMEANEARKREVVVPIRATPIPDRSNLVVERVDEFLDQFYEAAYRRLELDTFKMLSEGSYKPADISEAIEKYAALHKEVEVETEGYEHLSKTQKRSYLFVLDKIVHGMQLFLSSGKAKKTRKPRKKKVKSAAQLTAKVQYLKEDTTLKITSIEPTKIVGAKEVWLFNVRYSKLIHLVASDKLSVKGTSVIDYDPKASKTKILRKPEKNLKPLMDLGKATLLKEFGKLKTREQEANGRMGKDTLILRIV